MCAALFFGYKREVNHISGLPVGNGSMSVASVVEWQFSQIQQSFMVHLCVLYGNFRNDIFYNKARWSGFQELWLGIAKTTKNWTNFPESN